MKIRVIFAAFVISLGAVASADTFRHRDTGEVFYGFRTNRRAGGKLQVYHSEEKKMITIEENQYDITLDDKGRRDTIVHIPIRQAEALISKVVSDRIAQTIIDAANSGPKQWFGHIRRGRRASQYQSKSTSARCWLRQ